MKFFAFDFYGVIVNYHVKIFRANTLIFFTLNLVFVKNLNSKLNYVHGFFQFVNRRTLLS